MGKKTSGSSARGKQAKKSAKDTRKNKIDFSDIPELTDEQLKQMKRIGRPLLGMTQRQLISIRIDPNVLEEIKKKAKKKGKKYQTLINEILEKYVGKKAA